MFSWCPGGEVDVDTNAQVSNGNAVPHFQCNSTLGNEEAGKAWIPCYSASRTPSQTLKSSGAASPLHHSRAVETTGQLGELPGQVNASHTSALRSEAGSYSQKCRNKLVPVHINGSCASYFGITTIKEYTTVIRKLLERDPLLTFALQKALRFLKIAEKQPINHVTPDPSGQTSALFGMRITPCVWKCDM
eukprot:gene28572-31732_t